MKTSRQILPGALLLTLISLVACGLTQLSVMKQYAMGSLTLAILIGALLGNLLPQVGRDQFRPGLGFAQRHALRAGVALYGFNLSIQQIIDVGGSGILLDLMMVVSTLSVGWLIGHRLLKMDRDTVLLTAAGSAICGAAAVVATVPVLGLNSSEEGEKTAVAVASVVLFGTLAMFVYPLIYRWLGPQYFDFGTYIGSTVHEVAQVVAIGTALGDEVGHTAVIAKMIRVMLLVPFLLIVSAMVSRRKARQVDATVVAEAAISSGQDVGKAAKQQSISIPWFALCFIVIAGFNSLHLLPESWVMTLRLAGVLMLTTAMAALGVDTNISRMRQAGLRPLLLGAGLFVHLIVFGGLLNWLLH